METRLEEMIMEKKKEIADERIQFTNGGTEQELEEMYAYVKRKFPEFSDLPRDDAISMALFSSLPIDTIRLSTYNPSFKNQFVLRDGRELNHKQIMEMLKRQYGE